MRCRAYLVLLSVREDGGVPAGSAWADGDERPHTVLTDGYQVEFAVERDRDSVPASGTAVGEPGVFADLAAAVELARARGGRPVPGAVTPDPGFGFQFASVPVAVHEREAVAVIAGQGDHAGITGMPSASGDYLCSGERGMTGSHRRVLSAGRRR